MPDAPTTPPTDPAVVPGGATAPTTPTTPVAPATPPPDPLAAERKKALAQYAAKERELHAGREALRKQQAEFAAQREEWEKRSAEVQARERKLALARLDPLGSLEALGVDYDALTQAKIEGRPPASLAAKHALSEVEKLREELARQRAEEADSRKRAEEEARRHAETAAQAEEREAAEFLVRDLGEFVQAAPEKYEAILAYGASHMVAQEMQREYLQSGKYLAYGEAADRVEKQLRAEALKLESMKWYKAHREGQQQPAPQQTPQGTQAQQGQKTLTNDLTPGTTPGQKRRRSEQERIAAGIARAQAIESEASARRNQR